MSGRNLQTRRKQRIRAKLRRINTENKPRLAVHRTNANIYAQIIDDSKSITLVSASTIEKDVVLDGKNGGNKSAASLIGKLVAERAKTAGIENVVFDRSGYLYHGRIKALADAARQYGLNF